MNENQIIIVAIASLFLWLIMRLFVIDQCKLIGIWSWEGWSIDHNKMHPCSDLHRHDRLEREDQIGASVAFQHHDVFFSIFFHRQSSVRQADLHSFMNSSYYTLYHQEKKLVRTVKVSDCSSPIQIDSKGPYALKTFSERSREPLLSEYSKIRWKHSIKNWSLLCTIFDLTSYITSSIGGSTSHSAMRAWTVNSLTTSTFFLLRFQAECIQRNICNLNSFIPKENSIIDLHLRYKIQWHSPWSRTRHYTSVISHGLVLIWDSLRQLTPIFLPLIAQCLSAGKSAKIPIIRFNRIPTTLSKRIRLPGFDLGRFIVESKEWWIIRWIYLESGRILKEDTHLPRQNVR